MGDKVLKTVRDMLSGQSGRVMQIHGGKGIADRLYAMGITPGRRITKISSMFMRGPVTLRVGQMQVAIGYGMAGKIVVEVE